jgi:hypothetical protein
MVAELTALVTLREVMEQAGEGRPHEGEQPAPGLTVWLHGQRCELIGVGERTATLAPDGGWEGRVSKGFDVLMVDPGEVRWQARPPAPGATFRMLGNLDPATKHARAAYLAENNAVVEANRNRTAASGGSRGGGECSRDGCHNELAAHNRRGECTACQRKCPGCGRSKSTSADACQVCTASARRAGRTLRTAVVIKEPVVKLRAAEPRPLPSSGEPKSMRVLEIENRRLRAALRALARQVEAAIVEFGEGT